MVNVNKDIKKICSFYVSDWHFITMILPHINKSINEKVKINTILEKESKKKMAELLSKLKLENTEAILNIGWNAIKDIDEENIKNILRQSEYNKMEIIISGTVDYINKINKLIDEELYNFMKKENIIIINCYSAENEDLNMKEILNNHQSVLNTAGEKTVDKFKSELNII